MRHANVGLFERGAAVMSCEEEDACMPPPPPPPSPRPAPPPSEKVPGEPIGLTVGVSGYATLMYVGQGKGRARRGRQEGKGKGKARVC